CTRQQPGWSNTQPVPHSSPGRFQFEPPWDSGPHDGATVTPAGEVAVASRSPEPVMRQAIFTTGPTCGSPNSNPQASASELVAGTSLATIGDAGAQPARPSGLPAKSPVGTGRMAVIAVVVAAPAVSTVSVAATVVAIADATLEGTARSSLPPSLQ